MDGVATRVGGLASKSYEAASADVMAMVRGVGPAGVADATFDAALVPPGATTRTDTSTGSPFSRPLMMRGLAAEAGERVVHEPPPSVEYSTLVAGAPPVPAITNATDTWPSPAITLVMEGAAGVEAVIVKLTGADVAASRLPLAATDADMEQVPAATNVTAPVAAPTVHTPVVDDEYVTSPPVTEGVAAMVGAVSPNAYEAATGEVTAMVRTTGPVGALLTMFDPPLMPALDTVCRRTR